MRKPYKYAETILPFTSTGAAALANFSTGRCEGFFIVMKNCINHEILCALSNLGALAAKAWEINENKIDRELVREINEIARQVKHSLKIIEEVTK